MTRALLPLALVLPALGLAPAAFAIPQTGGEDDGDGWEDGLDEPGAPPVGEEPPDSYIVNGVEAGAGEWPEVVHLSVRGSDGGGNCTGSLIHPEWILTAAHCVDGETNGVTITFGNRAADTRKVEVEEWIIHRGWSGEETGDYEDDIAVLRLAEPVEDVFPMALNPDPMTDAWLGQQITFIGFGITRWGGGNGGIKRVADVPIIAIPETEPFLVNVYDGNQSTCQGDSGGPGVNFSGDAYVQVTVTSHGIRCGEGWSGHMRVDHYLEWIQRNTGVELQTRPGAPPDFVCSREAEPGQDDTIAVGVVDFDLRCQVRYHAPEELTSVRWQWGDGNSAEGQQVSHTYLEAGNYTVRMCAEGQRENGSTWEHCVPKNGYVRACDIPVVAFSVEEVDGLTWVFNNETDVSTYGCISELEWEVYDESGTLLDSLGGWSPEYTFEEPGDYRVVLNVGGIGGTSGAEATFQVRRRIGGGCDIAAASGTGLGALGLLLGLVVVRRRRD